MHVREGTAMVDGAVGVVLEDEPGCAHAERLELPGMGPCDVDDRLNDFVARGERGGGVPAVEYGECIIDEGPFHAGSPDVHT